MSTSSPAPLTTLFVPPNSCFTDVYLYSFTSGETPQLAEESSNGINYLGLPGTSNCLPTGWSPSTYFSPGFCPGGYTIACSFVNSIETVTETAAICCPSNFVCLPFSGYPWQATESCTSSFTESGIIIVTLSAGGSTTVAASSFDPGEGINAYSVQVRWQSTDIEILSPNFSVSAATSGAVSPASSVSSATTTSSPDNATTRLSPSSATTTSRPSIVATASNTSSVTVSFTPPQASSITTSAKIAICIIIPIIFCALLIGFFIFWQKRRSSRRRAPAAPVTDPLIGAPWWKPELDAEETMKKFNSRATTVELDTVAPCLPELGGLAYDGE